MQYINNILNNECADQTKSFDQQLQLVIDIAMRMRSLDAEIGLQKEKTLWSQNNIIPRTPESLFEKYSFEYLPYTAAEESEASWMKCQ